MTTKHICSLNINGKSFYVEKQIGQGTFSSVYMTKESTTNKMSALKLVKDCFNSIAKIEVEILQKFKHPNIVELLDHNTSYKEGYLFLEYFPYEDLGKYLTKNKIVDERTLKLIFGQLCSALEYAHGSCVAHHDIKPSNILMNHEGTIKLIDWGLSIKTKSKNTLVKVYNGSPVYLPPEVMKHWLYNPFLADMWSLGITMYELAIGVTPFEGSNYDSLAKEVFHKHVLFPIHTLLSIKFQNVIQMLLNKLPESRGTFNYIRTNYSDLLK